MARVPKKKKWPKGLPKPGSSKYNSIQRRIAENKKIEADIERVRKAMSKK